MDRNCTGFCRTISRKVALRKESVDRNQGSAAAVGAGPASLSARRAWIEMVVQSLVASFQAVALRKESVDRNISRLGILHGGTASLSARRAWIEMVAKNDVSCY